MGHGAIDLHKKESQVRLVRDDGIVVDRRIATRRESLTQVFGSVAPMRVLLEASTESEWVACHLEHLGHTVVVADPNYAPIRRLFPAVSTSAWHTSSVSVSNRALIPLAVFEGICSPQMVDPNETIFQVTSVDPGSGDGGPANRRLVCLIDGGGKLAVWGRDGNTAHIDAINEAGFP